MSWHTGTGVYAWRRGAPVRIRRVEKIGRSDGHSRCVWRDEVDLLLVSVIRRHVGQVRRVLVHGSIGGVRLRGLGDAMEVKLVSVSLAVHLGHYIFIVVVAQRTAQLVIVHVGLALALSPAPRNLVWVGHLELAIGPFPRDAASVGAVG